MRRSLVFLAAAAVSIDALPSPSRDVRSAPLISRRLDDGGGSSYNYLNDVSGYSMVFGKCVRVKIPQNNDDEEAEGNSYFANGRYHAQYTNYASFYLCDSDSSSSCSSCDFSIEYVTDLENYLEASTNYVKGLCNACSAYCRRQLEDAAEEEEEEEDGGDVYNYQSLDCSTCSKQCSNLNNNEGADETNYLECQEASDDGDIQYFSAPQCGSGNNIIIGLYYDDECTVKTSKELDYGFTYPTFHLVEDGCFNCVDGLCGDLYDESLHCQNGYNMNQGADDQDMPVCRTYKSMEDRTYNKRRKQLKFMPFIILAVVLVSLLVFGSYTYYIRHKNPLAEPLSGQGGQLPPIT